MIPHSLNSQAMKSIVKLDLANENYLEELQIYPRDEDDRNEIHKLVKQILNYPSDEAARRHEESNRLGSFDLVEGHPNRFDLSDLSMLGRGLKFCACCGFLKQEDSLKLCTRIKEITNLGISAYLYFRVVFVILTLTIIMMLMYTVFAVATNLLSSGPSSVEMESLDDMGKTVLDISLGSKHLNPSKENLNLFLFESWLGIAMIVLMGLLLIKSKRAEKQKLIRMEGDFEDEQSEDEMAPTSAADFSFLVEDAPPSLTQLQMQHYFDNYKRDLGHNEYSGVNLNFQIAKFNVGKPFYLDEQRYECEELDHINSKYADMIETFIHWVRQRSDGGQFSQLTTVRQMNYKQFATLRQQRFEAYQRITREIENQFKKQNPDELKNKVFITMHSKQVRDLILSNNNNDLLTVLREKIFCCFYQSKRLIIDGKEIKISPAPEPEDIIWVNLGHLPWERLKRRFITFLATFIILATSFGIVYGLSTLQKVAIQQNNNTISLIISLVITSFNLLIQYAMRQLTLYERDYSETKHQVSLSVKAICALLINSILVPCLVSFLTNSNIYRQNGLIHDIFILSITNSFISPLLKLFNPTLLYTKVLKCFHGRPHKKLHLTQHQLNAYYERIPFEAGYEYIYLINIYLFTCFFLPLQPIITVFAAAGVGLMYWAQKYSLFKHCKRPVPGTTMINSVMFQFIYLGPLFYSIGHLLWSGFFPDEQVGAYIYSTRIVSFVLACVILILPYEAIFEYVYKDSQDSPDIHYEDKRIFFPSEYDRLNPATSKAAIDEHLAYVKQYRENLSHMSSVEQKRVERNFLRQVLRGNQQENQIIPHRFGWDRKDQRENILQQIYSAHPNVINPLLTGAAVLPKSQLLRPELLVFGAPNPANSSQPQEESIDVNDLLVRRFSKVGHWLSDSVIDRNADLDLFEAVSPNIIDPANNFTKIFSLKS